MRTRRSGRWLLKQPRLGARMCQWHILFYIGHILLILLHLYKRRNRPVNLGRNLVGGQMLHQGFTILHQEGEEHGADIIRQFRKYRADLRIFREMLQQVAVIGTPFFNGLPEGIKGAVAGDY